MTSILLVTIFVISLFGGVPIFIVLGIVSMIWLVIKGESLLFIAQTMYTATDQYPIIAIIGFTLAGSLMHRGRLSQDLINLATVLVGHIRGGLAIASQLACMMFASLSGSSPATAAAVGATMVSAMDRQKYTKAFAGATIASAGTLGILIPPSNPLIFYGIITNQSIIRMFIASIIPGLLIGIVLMITTYYISCRRGYIGSREVFSLQKKIKVIWKSKWALLLPVIILGGIYLGVFTPVEAAVVGVFYSLIVAIFVYKLKLKELLGAFEDTALMAGTVSIIISTSTIFGRVLTVEGIPQIVASAITQLTSDPLIIILLVAAFFLITGMFFETIANIIVFVPIFMPLLISAEINLIYFGIILIIVSEIGLLTPPVALNVFVTSRIAEVRFEEVLKEIVPYILVFLVVILVFIFFPSIIMFYEIFMK